jgi:hypothetical protein
MTCLILKLAEEVSVLQDEVKRKRTEIVGEAYYLDLPNELYAYSYDATPIYSEFSGRAGFDRYIWTLTTAYFYAIYAAERFL